MARPGRKPKPPHLKLLQGNPGKRPIPESVKPPPAAPNAPSWAKQLPGEKAKQLRKDAVDEWKRVVPVLDGLGLLSTVDGAVLADYCVCWARLLECERTLAVEGLVRDVYAPKGEDGEMVLVGSQRHPLSVTAKEYRSALKSFCGELGLSPSSRGRLQVPGGPNDDDDLFD